MAIESPKYEVLKTYDGFEVRRYGSYVVAETEVDGTRGDAGNAAFGVLAGYIFGANTSSAKIDMTAPVTQKVQSQKIEMTSPVTQTQSGAVWKVQFSMPAKWTMETLPKPQDPRVTLRIVPERVVAVMRYSGTWSEANFQEHLTKLQEGLKREGLNSGDGEPTWARYDPPWTPWFLRKNEVQLELVSPPSP
ncbi:MAG: heme-binding protein [Archangium sp.]|nr:heme-binding protein [Archangium sp.]MDP3575411.1 heme-binding protein [Archangium sp.]